MSAQHIFTKVSIRGDRERIYSRLAAERATFTFQMAKKSFHGRVFDRHGTQLVFDVLDGGPIGDGGEAIVSFSLHPEIYFMRTRIYLKKEHAVVDLAGDLFKLQRRDNFRLVVPTSYRARFELRTVDVESMKAEFPVVDLSGGGLSFEMLYANDLLRPGTHITGILRVTDDFSKPIVAIVKHVRPFGSMGSGLFRCGIQFEEMPLQEREEIIQLVMRIHREAFSKFKIA